MSSNVLIGVGGSGQHVVHAYLNLLALGNTPASEVPFVFIIDADVTNSSPLYYRIEKLHERLTSPLDSSKNKATLSVIRPYPLNNADQSKTSEQALGLANTEAWLADAFLIDDADFSQFSDKNIKVNEGMMANARIGSAVFSATNPLEQLRQVVANKQVAIVGSTFGGTGSGVIPTLVRLLDKQENNPPNKVRAFMTLPWFEITGESSKGKSAAHTLGALSPMKRNAALGLRTYKQELSGFTRSNYVITQFLSGQQPKPAKRPDDGNFEQSEHKHVFNLVLANAIQNFFYVPSPTVGQLMTLKARGEEVNGVFNAATSVNLRFLRLFLDADANVKKDEVSLEELMINTELVALVLEKAALFIDKGSKQFKVPKADSAKEPSGLRSFIETLYIKNHGALPKDNALLSSVTNFFTTSVPKHLDTTYEKLSNKLKEQADTLRKSLIWLRDHIESEQNKTGLKTSQSIQPLTSVTTTPEEEEKQLIKEVHKNVYWPNELVIKNMQAKSDKPMVIAQTDKITLAFYIFLNTFYKQEQNVINDGHETELTERIKKAEQRTDSYGIAAQLLTEKIYDQIIKARERLTKPEHNADEQPAKEMLNGFNTLSTTQDNHVFFKFAQNDLGLLDNGQTEEEHPYSIRYLDPFLGIQNVRDLIKQPSQPEAKGIFLETALKGVPNIIAPLLVQKWRLTLLSDPQIQQDLSFTNKESLTKSEPPLSTPYGIYLHARRVIEAAFWLLFNQDNRVLLVSNDSPTEGSFVNIINSELKKYEDTNLHPEGLKPLKYFIKSTVNGRPLFLYDDTYGWYLAANKTARQFFASIMPELPSVKYGHSKLDSLWRGEEYQTKPMSKPETYDTGLINAFLGYVKQFSELQTSPQWSNVIQDLINDLSSKGFSPIDLKNLSVRVDDIKLPFNGRADALELKSLENIKNTSLSSLAIPNPIFYYKTDNNGNLSPLQPKELLWPLKGKAWEHLVPPKEDAVNAFGEYKLLSNATRSVWSWETLQLNFKGLGKKTFNKPFNHVIGVDAREEQFFWSVGVWPNFILEDWNYYIAIGDFNAIKIKNIDLRGFDLQGDTVEFVFYGNKDGDFQELGRSLHAIPIKLKGVPRSVEIVLAGRVLGSVPIQLKEIVPAKLAHNGLKVALDFGTSNTCMAAIFEQQGAESKPLPLLEGQIFEYTNQSKTDKLILEDLTWSTGNLLRSKDKYPHQLLPALFFQSFASQTKGSSSQKTESKPIPISIPSELLWAKGIGESAQTTSNRLKYLQGADAGKVYYKDFGIVTSFGGSSPEQCLSGQIPVVAPFWTPFPPAVSEDLLIQLKESTNSFYVDGFKWHSQSGDKRYAYRAVYLENILVAAFATLRLSGYTKLAEIIATYPGAFSSQTKDGKKADTESYKEDLSLIIDKLSQQTGVAIHTTAEHKPAITLRSETCAALAGCGRDTSEISLTIDMGGGTTDIGLIIPDKDKPTDLTKLKYYMASLRYAGTHLLNAIVEYDHLKKPIESKDALFLEWKLKLRAGGDIKLGENKSAYDRITCAFFEGLFEYVFNMLIAFKKFLPADKEVKVYLLGNGFKLAQVFCGVGGIQKEEEKVFFNNIVAKAQKSDLLDANIKIALQQPQDQDKKQALINGVFKIREGSDTGMQYTYIETKGHGTKPLILPCLMVSDQSSNQPYLVQEDKYEEFNKALLDKNVSTTDDWQQRKKAFKLTSYYWEHQNVTRNNLFNQAVIKEHATDFGKFYLEHGYVTEVLYKLVTEQKAPVQEQVRKVEPEVTNTPHQQSGFNPNAVSESMAVPPVQTVPPPQSPNNSASIVTLSSGANTLINGDNITVTLNWQSPFKLDVIAFALNDKGKVTADENTIFYNQLNYAQGAVQLNEAQRQLNIVLSKIPSDIKTIAICAVTGIDDESAKGKNFGQVSHSAINVLASNKIIFELNHVKGTETAMIFGEVYRHKDTWKFRAKGQGYAGGFKKMCDEYGAEY